MHMSEDHVFDLIVIGTGTAASTTAHECSSAGWKVAIVDSLSFGGTCALRGCEPKKVLVEAAKVVDSAQRHQNNGVLGYDKVHIKWSDLMHFKRTFTEPFPKHREEGYKKAGIVPFHGHARFIGSNAIRLEGGEEEEEKEEYQKHCSQRQENFSSNWSKTHATEYPRFSEHHHKRSILRIWRRSFA